MKANEAPKKIYLQKNTTTDCYGEFWPEWFEARAKDTDVEYIRTDAFIEKACSWLRTHSEADYFELIPDANYCGAGNLNKKKMIEDFRKYMKG